MLSFTKVFSVFAGFSRTDVPNYVARFTIVYVRSCERGMRCVVVSNP